MGAPVTSRYLVFLSYVSADAGFVSSVADRLESQRVAAFAAHRDIPGGEEWLPHIERALLRCNALAAFVTSGFGESEWTDQEVGYVLGRRKKVVPVRFSSGVTPRGFLNRYQAPNVGDLDPAGVANVIIDALLRYPEERRELIEPLAESLERDRELERLRTSVLRLRYFTDLPPDQVRRLNSIAASNAVLRHDRELRHALRTTLASLGHLE